MTVTIAIPTLDMLRYIENEWYSEPLCPCCREPSDISKKLISDNILTEELLIEILIKQSRESGENVDEIPSKFYRLAKTITKSTDNNDLETEIWIEFGQWLGLNEPISRKDVRNHLKSKWRRIVSASKVRKLKAPEIPQEVQEIKSKEIKSGLIVSAQDNNITNYRYVTNSECIVDKYNKTLVHLGLLDDFEAVIKATEAINSYYFHTLENESH
jgi:hypothetical protein